MNSFNITRQRCDHCHIHRRRSSTLGGGIFARKISSKNQQNARILHDSCPKNYQNIRIFMIFARKLYKIPEFCMIFARKMPEFYIIIARKMFSPNFREGGTCTVPPLAPRLLRLWRYSTLNCTNRQRST